MSRNYTWVVRLLVAAAATAAGATLLGMSGLLVCSSYPTYKDVPTDCTVDDGYEFQTIDDFSKDNFWFVAPDYVSDAAVPPPDAEKTIAGGGGSKYVASQSVSLATIPDGPMCGNATAGVFRASHNNDWGGLFGMWSFSDTTTDNRQNASQYQGISFWARAPGNTSKGFTLLLDDDNTKVSAVGHKCRDYGIDGGVGSASSTTTSFTDPGTGTPITGSSNTRAAYTDECGNGYYVVLQVTSDWRFYTIPWSQFQQNFTPNRVPNAALAATPGDLDAGTTILTAALRGIGIRLPREAEMELWLANLAFYRKQAQP
jgi:hypothetical protein